MEGSLLEDHSAGHGLGGFFSSMLCLPASLQVFSPYPAIDLRFEPSAGLLSSYGEMQHLRSGNAELWPFDPFQRQPKMSYKDGYQKGYFVLESFKAGTEQLKDFCSTLPP